MKRKVYADKRLLAKYLLLDEFDKEAVRDAIFTKYWTAHDKDIDLTLDAIKGDIWFFEQEEQFERCQLLKDILTSFE